MKVLVLLLALMLFIVSASDSQIDKEWIDKTFASIMKSYANNLIQDSPNAARFLYHEQFTADPPLPDDRIASMEEIRGEVDRFIHATIKFVEPIVMSSLVKAQSNENGDYYVWNTTAHAWNLPNQPLSDENIDGAEENAKRVLEDIRSSLITNGFFQNDPSLQKRNKLSGGSSGLFRRMVGAGAGAIFNSIDNVAPAVRSTYKRPPIPRKPSYYDDPKYRTMVDDDLSITPVTKKRYPWYHPRRQYQDIIKSVKTFLKPDTVLRTFAFFAGVAVIIGLYDAFKLLTGKSDKKESTTDEKLRFSEDEGNYQYDSQQYYGEDGSEYNYMPPNEAQVNYPPDSYSQYESGNSMSQDRYQ